MRSTGHGLKHQQHWLGRPQCIDKLHTETLEQAMHLLREFAERMHAPPSQITSWARPQLENLANTLLAEIPSVGFPDHQQRARKQYTQVFKQRLDGALRDIEIGFIGGRSIVTDSQTSQSRALRLLKRIYDRTRDRTEPVFVAELAQDAGLTEEESQAAWHYLKDKGLIQTFKLLYTARVNAAGIHAIEDALRDPDRPSQAFPSITYNIVNVRTAINSPMQQAGAQSMQKQVVTYSAQELSDLARLISEFANHLDELKLDTRMKQRVTAQLATLEAQLSDKPDRVIVRQVGQTLRNITEGAIGSLIAAAAQPTIWSWVAEIMARLFS